MNNPTSSILDPAFNIIKHIEDSGGEGYIVGGAVRDFLSNRPVKDIDIATSEPPERIQQLFDKVIPVGIEHGTVIVHSSLESFEVTTYRIEEGYHDYRHPDEVTFVKDIRKDLSRRDFTMNAMAIDRQGNVVDPFNGLQAIKEKKIEAVGHATVRFQEDPLRIMRAIRFASQLEFMIENITLEAIISNAHLLSHIAVERVAVEYEKVFAGKGYTKGLELLIDTGIAQYLPIKLPNAIHSQVPNEQLNSFVEIISYYTNLYPEHSVIEWVRQWKLSNKVKREALCMTTALQNFFEENEISAWILYFLPNHLFPSFQRVLHAKGWDNRELATSIKEIEESLPIRSRKELAFQARDLISLYQSHPKGPWISEWMRRIEYAVVESHISNDYEKIKEWVREWNPPENS